MAIGKLEKVGDTTVYPSFREWEVIDQLNEAEVRLELAKLPGEINIGLGTITQFIEGREQIWLNKLAIMIDDNRIIEKHDFTWYLMKRVD